MRTYPFVVVADPSSVFIGHCQCKSFIRRQDEFPHNLPFFPNTRPKKQAEYFEGLRSAGLGPHGLPQTERQAPPCASVDPDEEVKVSNQNQTPWTRGTLLRGTLLRACRAEAQIIQSAFL
jgi:hypothetical protein